jgi:hypothetical protein
MTFALMDLFAVERNGAPFGFGRNSIANVETRDLMLQSTIIQTDGSGAQKCRFSNQINLFDWNPLRNLRNISPKILSFETDKIDFKN